MYITIRLRSDARADNEDTRGLPADLAAEAKDLGVEILPMHPDTVDPQLNRYFYADLIDPSRAGDVAERLGRIPSVDGVYIKPPEGPP